MLDYKEIIIKHLRGGMSVSELSGTGAWEQIRNQRFFQGF